jgi:hypothetical protein
MAQASSCRDRSRLLKSGDSVSSEALERVGMERGDAPGTEHPPRAEAEPVWQLPNDLVRDLVVAAELSAEQESAIRRDGIDMAMADEAASFLASLPAKDPWARYLREEGKSVSEAFRRGIEAGLVRDALPSVVFGRLVLETAIRMVWVGDQPGNADATRTRLGRLEKRDLAQLIRASDTIAVMSTAAPLLTNADRLKSELDSIAEKAAPEPREMASEAGIEPMYAVYRYFATATHPGIAARAGVPELMDVEETMQILRFAYALAEGAIWAISDTLFGPLPPEVIRIIGKMMYAGGVWPPVADTD